MKRFAALLLLYYPVIVAASDADAPFLNNRELGKWCELNSKYYLNHQGLEVYNWSASENVKGNNLSVKGGWRKQGGRIEVFCAVERQARRRFAVMRISGEEVEVYPKGWYPGLDVKISLLEWCKYTSAKRFLIEEQYPYNWRFSYDEKEGLPIIQGEWRVNFETRKVSCTMSNGEMTIEMAD